MTSTCLHCQHELPPTGRFCPGCGVVRSTGAPNAATTQPTPSAPPTASAPANDASRSPALDLTRILAGNWLGAAIVAASTAGTAGVMASLLTLLLKPTDFGLDNSLTLVAALMTGAFGADLGADLRIMGTPASGSIGAFPLTITVAALAIAVWTFRRVTARYQRALDAIGDAARAALLLGLSLMAVALVFRADSREFGRGWGAELASLFGGRIQFGAGAGGAFFLGTLILFVVLFAACLVRGGWWPPAVERIRVWIAAPLYGVGVFAALLPLTGLIGVGLLMISGDAVDDTTDVRGEDLRFSVGIVTGLLANGGVWLLGLGSGSAFGYRGDEDGRVTEALNHLAHFTDESPGLWAAPLVLLGVLLTTAVAVARRATPENLVTSLAVWVATVLLTTPLFVRLSNLHVSFAYGDRGRNSGEASLWSGLLGWQSTILMTLVAAVCALIAAWRSGAFDAEQVRARTRQLADKYQRNPGHQAPPPSS